MYIGVILTRGMHCKGREAPMIVCAMFQIYSSSRLEDRKMGENQNWNTDPKNSKMQFGPQKSILKFSTFFRFEHNIGVFLTRGMDC